MRMLEQRIPWQIVQDYPFVLSIGDEREEVVSHWRDAKSWVVPPVVVSGDLLGGGTGFELLVGFTRLGNLLGQCADLEQAATGILQRRFSAGLDDLDGPLVSLGIAVGALLLRRQHWHSLPFTPVVVFWCSAVMLTPTVFGMLVGFALRDMH